GVDARSQPESSPESQVGLAVALTEDPQHREEQHRCDRPEDPASIDRQIRAGHPGSSRAYSMTRRTTIYRLLAAAGRRLARVRRDLLRALAAVRRIPPRVPARHEGLAAIADRALELPFPGDGGKPDRLAPPADPPGETSFGGWLDHGEILPFRPLKAEHYSW